MASVKPVTKTMLSLGNLPPKPKTQNELSSTAGWPRTPTRVDPNNPPWPAYRGYHEYSFAYATMGKRLPTILGKAIDDVVKTLNEQVRNTLLFLLIHFSPIVSIHRLSLRRNSSSISTSVLVVWASSWRI